MLAKDRNFLEDVIAQMGRRTKLIVNFVNVKPMTDYDFFRGRDDVIKTYSLICQDIQEFNNTLTIQLNNDNKMKFLKWVEFES
jgi:hypothetical protein